MKRTLITIALTTLVVLTLVGGALFSLANSFGGASPISRGIGGGADDSYFLSEPSFAPAAPAPMEFYAEEPAAEFARDQSAANAATERLVIQNVDMSIVVADPQARMEEIADMATAMGGFVVSSNLYQSTYGPNQIKVPEGSITVRVPSERLDEALETIKEGAVDVNYENRSGEDVTEQYVNLQSRLKAKQAAEEKLLEFLEDAEDTEAALSVYVQLQQIQSEIEVLTGQIQFYEQSAALSAVSVRLIAEETVQPIEIGGWRLQGTVNEAVQDLILFTQGFTRFLIRFVLTILPALILIAIPAFLVFLGGRALFRRFRRSKAVVEPEEKK
jgi:hypothetical protein